VTDRPVVLEVQMAANTAAEQSPSPRRVCWSALDQISSSSLRHQRTQPKSCNVFVQHIYAATLWQSKPVSRALQSYDGRFTSYFIL